MKKLLAFLVVLAVVSASSTALAAPRKVLVVWGDFGRAMMQPLADAISAKGYAVTMISHASPIPPGPYYACVSHSAGDRSALGCGASKIITLDPTYLNQGCSNAVCTNYYNPANKWMFFGLCCGGFEVRGASNYIVNIPHVDFPRMMKTTVLRVLGG